MQVVRGILDKAATQKDSAIDKLFCSKFERSYQLLYRSGSNKSRYLFQLSLLQDRSGDSDAAQRYPDQSTQTHYKEAESHYGSDLLDLVVAKGYLIKMLANQVVQSLVQRHEPEILKHFELVVNTVSMEVVVQQRNASDQMTEGHVLQVPLAVGASLAESELSEPNDP